MFQTDFLSIIRSLVLCTQYQTPDYGQKICLKHAELYSKNKCEKLVHLVGFIIRIYHDALSHECQICLHIFFSALTQQQNTFSLRKFFIYNN